MIINSIARATVLAAFLGASLAAPASAQSSIEDALDTPRFMLYATKRFGAADDVRTASSFGLRYEQPVSIGSMDWQMDASDIRFVPMLDYRFSHGVGTQLSLYNFPMYSTGAYYDSVSSSAGLGTGTKVAMGVAAAALILCVAEEGICEDDDDNPPVSPGLE